MKTPPGEQRKRAYRVLQNMHPNIISYKEYKIKLDGIQFILLFQLKKKMKHTILYITKVMASRHAQR